MMTVLLLSIRWSEFKVFTAESVQVNTFSLKQLIQSDLNRLGSNETDFDQIVVFSNFPQEKFYTK